MTDKELRKEFRRRERRIERWGGVPIELPWGETPTKEKYEERKLYLLSLLPEAYKWTETNKSKYKPRNRPTSRSIEDCVKKNIQHAKQRAKRKGIEFDISINDLEIPTHCPILGIELAFNNSVVSDNSPSLDRKDSSKGYVKGNVWVISNRANTIKSVGTAEEHLKIYQAMKEF